MIYIRCKRCGHQQGYFTPDDPLQHVDMLVIKEHLLVCDLVQHGLTNFSQVEPQDPLGQESLQVRFPIDSEAVPVTSVPWWIYITTSSNQMIAQWVARDTATVTRTCSAPTGYGVFREINRYLGSIT